MVRAVAALLVILFHIQNALGIQVRYAPVRDIFSAGHRGVDLFFVLSGFIIAYSHRKDLGRQDRLGNYLFNRFARIYPAVWIMSALAIVVYMVGFSTPDKADKLTPGAIVASAFLLPQVAVPLVNVTWTLTYEIFFYFLFGILIINFRIGLAIFILWQMAVVTVALTDVNLGLAGYYLRAVCLDFSVGLACAWWIHQMRKEVLSSAVWVGLLISGVLGFGVGMWFDATAQWSAIPCALGAGVIIVSLVVLEQMKHLRVPDLIVKLGGASYSVYLVHFSVIQMLSTLLRRIGVPATDILFLIYLPAGVLAGMAFDHWVDRPIQRRLQQLKPMLLQATSRASSRTSVGKAGSRGAFSASAGASSDQVAS